MEKIADRFIKWAKRSIRLSLYQARIDLIRNRLGDLERDLYKDLFEIECLHRAIRRTKNLRKK